MSNDMNKKEAMNGLFDSTLVTLGAVGVGMLTRKAFGNGLSTPASLMTTLKLAAAIGLSTLGVKYAQDKKYGFLKIHSNKWELLLEDYLMQLLLQVLDFYSQN